MGFFVEPLEHVINLRGQILTSRTDDDPPSTSPRVYVQNVPVCTGTTPTGCTHVDVLPVHTGTFWMYTRFFFQRASIGARRCRQSAPLWSAEPLLRQTGWPLLSELFLVQLAVLRLVRRSLPELGRVFLLVTLPPSRGPGGCALSPWNAVLGVHPVVRVVARAMRMDCCSCLSIERSLGSLLR